MIKETHSTESEVGRRIQMASMTFGSLSSCLWSRSEISKDTKMSIFKTAVMPTLLYGCETWVPIAEDIHRFEVVQMRCLRKILKISINDHKSNKEIRKIANIQTIESRIRQKRLLWFGHVNRMESNRTPLKVCGSVSKNELGWKKKEGWRRRNGGAYKKWSHVVKSDVQKTIIDNYKRRKIREEVEFAKTLTKCVKTWEEFVERVCNAPPPKTRMMMT